MIPEYPEKYFSPRCKDFLQQLLQKDPDRRLGRNGIDEIMKHPWFDEIDFGLLEACYLDPPFVPNLDEVNADCLRHISRPPQDERYKSVKLTKEFEQKLTGFPYKSAIALQEEIVDVLEKSTISSKEGKLFEKPTEDTPQPNENKEQPGKLCCTIM